MFHLLLERLDDPYAVPQDLPCCRLSIEMPALPPEVQNANQFVQWLKDNPETAKELILALISILGAASE